MAETGQTKRTRDPEATRAAILDAALSLMAKDGAEAVSLSEVAHRAGINRGTAYQHFRTREKLIEATIAWVSDKMFRAVFGDPETIGERRIEDVDMIDTTERMAAFGMDNPELCRIWLLQMLASNNTSADPFWREYAGSIARFAETELAEPHIDVEPFSILMLAGNFLWPIWTHAKQRSDAEKKELAHRFAQESLRLCMYGTLNADALPQIATQLRGHGSTVPKLRVVG